MNMPNNTFKDFPNQSHIELKFGNKDQHQLEREEALQKYRKNINIITKIFTFDFEKNKSETPKIKQKDDFTIDPTILAQFTESLSKLKEKHQQSLEEFRVKNEQFANIMKDDFKINNQEEFINLVNDLQIQGLLTDQHPFLDQRSNFYLKCNLEQPIQISYEQCQDLKMQLKDEQATLLG